MKRPARAARSQPKTQPSAKATSQAEKATISPKPHGWRETATGYRTDLGTAYLGNSLSALSKVPDHSVDLILTSPPYALLTEKEYGNASEEQYVEWFTPFATLFKKKLKANGSFVLNLGGSWKENSPERSLYQYRLLLMLCGKEMGFHLCQDFYWFNPAKLPAPIEWVNRKRVRVKDSVEQIYWLSPTTNPYAKNDNVLVEYSKSMKRLIKTGKYNWGKRPSGHNMGRNWGKDNGGAIPPNLLLNHPADIIGITDDAGVPNNLLVESNTNSSDDFLRRSRELGYRLHPARFPRIIPEFFIRLLTKRNGIVCDPFAGSNTTGAMSEALGRKWISVEMNQDYFTASSLRFSEVKWID
jgi:DNA modification methylase